MKPTTHLYYIDNLKTLIILSLFFVHACEMYHIGDGFFIEGPEILVPTMLYSFFTPFIMSVLFFLAGISTVYSLEKRGVKGFFANRCKKLLIPLAVGLVTFLPLQSWFILKNHTDFNGTFLDAYKHFFTHCTDFYGYDGAIAPAHLWFLLYLFAITVLCFPLISRYHRLKDRFSKLHFDTRWVLALIGTVLIVNYGPSDEGVCRFIVYYVLGIVLCENQSFNDYIEKRGKILLCTGIIFNLAVPFIILHIKQGEIFTFAYFWRRALWAVASVLMTLGTVGAGKSFLNKTNAFFHHFSRLSFRIYYLHLPIMLAIGYFVLKMQIHYSYQILLIMTGSFFLTFLLSELLSLIHGRNIQSF